MQEMDYYFDKESRELEKKADEFGLKIKNSVESKSKLLNNTVSQISNVSTIGNNIESNISNLNSKIIELDPSKLDFSKIGNLFFDPVKKYFNKFNQYDLIIGIIIEDLDREKQILERDNITLQLEIDRLNEILEELEEAEQEGQKFKEEVQNIINALEEDGEKDKVSLYNQNILEVLEKRLYDIKEMKIVKQQTLLAFDIIRRNNKEIIRNIDRVKNVTISALKTAVMVAKSIYNQKIVLNKINSINLSAENIVNSTTTSLEKHEEELFENNKQQLLQETFNNVLVTIDEVSNNNKITLPDSSKKLVELKNMEENNEG